MGSNAWRKNDPERAYSHLKKWRENNPDKFKVHRQRYRSTHKDKIAEDLRKRRAGELGPFSASDGPDWQEKNAERFRQQHRDKANKSRHRLRLEAIAYYGGKCFCCGEKNSVFLALDHIHGGGNQHRKVAGGHLHVWAKKNGWPPIFRIACHNCNFALYHCDGVCPHQLPI